MLQWVSGSSPFADDARRKQAKLFPLSSHNSVCLRSMTKGQRFVDLETKNRQK